MAGGKLTPRQKMINLMYLVFIAMLALNMSKEVLSAFGIFDNKIVESNKFNDSRNEASFQQLAQKAKDQPLQYGDKKVKVEKIRAISKEFSDYLENLKTLSTKEFPRDQDGNYPAEKMDKGDFFDNMFFKGDLISKEGQDFVNKINTYAQEVKKIGGSSITESQVIKIQKRFSTEVIKSKKAGVNLPWLDYNYKGFPLIASVAKLTQLQSDIKTTESDIMASMFQSDLEAAASLNSFQTFVVLDKSVYFQGESVTGKVIIGKYDENLRARSVTINGSNVNAEAGQAKFSFGAGNVGEKNINGSFDFDENGKVVSLPIKSTYVVVSRPNSANISADKMNVVYRGVDNPMTISFAGVSDSDVTASAPGMTKAAGNGKYIIRPSTGSEISIVVNGTLPDKSKVSDRKIYRIKDIPGPTGTIGGDMGVVKGPISRLENSQIGALIPGFDFDVKLNVNAFNLKVTGQPTVVVTGNRLNAQAKSVLKKVQRGDQVTISEIKTTLVGSTIFLPRTNIVIFEVN
jgi:gliding motility-associated protein GldM